MRPAVLAVLAVVACRRSAAPQPLSPAGSDRDDGHGQLAHASASLLTNDDRPDRPAPRARRRDDADRDEDSFDAEAYAGVGYGGASYASYRPPPWRHQSVQRTPKHAQRTGLSAAIEGTITWRGPAPRVTTSCGVVDPLDIRAGAVGGLVVYLDRVSVGRQVLGGNGDQRPATVGGTVVKRGCALAPAVQIVTPLPAALAIHGDAVPTRLRITPPGNTSLTRELHEGGRVVLQAPEGATRIESEDGTLGAAWAVGLATPSYAITDDRGRYRIEEVAPGTYSLVVWQPPIPTVKDGKLVYGAPVITRRAVRVEARTVRVDVSLGR